ncbi:cysteinyl-tRNA synthetase [Pseudovirgaria hyperparasitica]|uniref:cysteine--tRNA ligase n=1 Tax=Pseudovirgaria hyperparasitica TaxID=470096 RepID=A0A6A6VXH0_9PEZI|nr:cysteinyl-tRNA synthetase [Pseudovirgaria hyperparasitica]KAF2753951.1 cysteinyl-tRNA synthetase [Pseudovirgaria hyperparasitica]
MATTRQQPVWQDPKTQSKAETLPALKVYNSLTRSKTPFTPLDPAGKAVTWYACGPTVYDDAHLGHARNYVSTDIIRRIMRDYFKFDMKFVMNITDVDDKIILRGRQQHLFGEFVEKHKEIDEEVLDTTTKAYAAYIKKNLKELPEGVDPQHFPAESMRVYQKVLFGGALEGDGPAGDKEAKVKMHIKTATSAAEVLSSASDTSKKIKPAEFYARAEDVLLPYLDSLYGAALDTSDHSIFTKLTKKFEDRFMEDVRALNCLDPDVLTRVTEYGPQIVDFVQKIEKNSFGYATSDGSVYFDIDAFEKAGNNYSRLEPWNRGNQELQADGEGSLTNKTSEKRSDADFALWKSSKPGEPYWPSPWGQGRPGWHIECSAMASDVLGPKIDIHSGGIDLAFPHHDNELAQSEAFWANQETGHGHDHGDGTHQWVNYFLHMGHLSISGSKMSKSLKNFTTIREALQRGEWTPRGLRIVFLLGGWHDGVEITPELVKAGESWEDKVQNFFLKAQDLQRNPKTSTPNADADSALAEALSSAQSALDVALCDSFDTPAAMRTISQLITQYNAREKEMLSPETVLSAARWITNIVTVFGLNGSARVDAANAIGWAGADIPDVAKQFIYPAAKLRDEIRRRAIAGQISSEEVERLASEDVAAKHQEMNAVPYAEVLSQFQEDVRALGSKSAPSKDYLALCDKLRDVQLWDLGIYLEDREGGQPAMVRPVDQQLVAERADKEAREQAKKDAKAKREKEEAEKAAKKLEQAKLSHLDMYKTKEYSAWDDEGLPTKDAKGDEIPKNKTKKLKKEWEKQKKLHEEWKARSTS